MSDLLADRHEMIWTFPDSGSGRPRTVNFLTEQALIGNDAISLVDAAWAICGNGRPNTIRNVVYTVRRIAAVLAMRRQSALTIESWAEAYLTALQEDASISEGTRWTYFNTAQQLFSEVARVRGESFRARNPFVAKTVSTKPLVHGDDLAPLMSQARLDALAIAKLIDEPPKDHMPFIREARALLADGILVGYNNGRINERATDKGDALARKWYRSTGLPLEQLVVHVYPTPLRLLPFYLLLSFALAANPDSLSLLKQDEISEAVHPFTGPILQLDMKKPRAGEIPQRFIRDGGTLTEGWLLRKVLKFRESIEHLVDDIDDQYVFLCVSRNMGGRASAFRGSIRSNTMRAYLKAHEFAATTIKQLRAARLTDEWIRTRDPLRVWRLSGNARLEMIAEYILNAESSAADAKSLAEIQRTIMSPRPKANLVPEEARAMTSTHICKNVFDESRRKDQHGFCVSYLWPFNDVHFILPLEARPIAFLLRDYRILCEAEKSLNPDRFEKLYAAKKRLIETEYLPLIDDQLMKSAEDVLSTLPSSQAIVEAM